MFAGKVELSTDNELEKLLCEAAKSKARNLNYTGDISPCDAFSYIRNNKSAVVDVRTVPEWQFVGVPDLSDTASKLITLSWKIYPNFANNPKFFEELNANLDVSKDTPLFFICRSGGRSLDAAIAATEAGYKYCFNVAGGFEGEPDEKGQRSSKQGWKHDKLPWVQG